MQAFQLMLSDGKATAMTVAQIMMVTNRNRLFERIDGVGAPVDGRCNRSVTVGYPENSGSPVKTKKTVCFQLSHKNSKNVFNN